MLKYFHMMEQMPSSHDMYVTRMARKMREAEAKEKAETKADLTDRIVDRIGQILKAKARIVKDALRANSHNERAALIAQAFELVSEEERLKDMFDRILKPSIDELMFG